MEEQHVYPISKQVIGGDVQSLKLTPKQFNAYRDEQDALRSLINAKAVEAKRKPIFTSTHDDFSNFHIVPIEDGKFKIIKRERSLSMSCHMTTTDKQTSSQISRAQILTVSVSIICEGNTTMLVSCSMSIQQVWKLEKFSVGLVLATGSTVNSVNSTKRIAFGRSSFCQN